MAVLDDVPADTRGFVLERCRNVGGLLRSDVPPGELHGGDGGLMEWTNEWLMAGVK